jgi:uncharacterized membrane protein
MKSLNLTKTLLLLSITFFLSSCLTNVEEQLEDTIAEEPVIESKVSFKDNVKPIIDARCTTCHSTSGGTFPNLTGFANVKAKADRIKVRVDNRSMPLGGSLTNAQIESIVKWVNEGALNN